MPRDPRFDILFEPIKLGPVTAPNRFYQVPHCTGMGYQLPETLAAMRAVKAEGGWGVVNTEYCSIDPTSDDLPAPFASLWDHGDVRNMAKITAGIHRHGALAGVELWHGGARSANFHSRAVPLSTDSVPTTTAPWQSQRMDRADIKAYRARHKAAALRAREAGFDIVYAYAAHTYLLAQFLDPSVNRRQDEYGGSLQNRSRLLRELLEDMKEAIGAHCAIAVRIEVSDEDDGGVEERSELLKSLAPLVNLFDVTIPDYTLEMGTSRFIKEGALEQSIAHVRAATGKPVVSVGRFTSPDTMLSQIKRGVVDLIGAARPSISDPFLPLKIREGRFDDIRECIGCNICYAHDGFGVPIRCTQNPTMGEEWRRGWHPEIISATDARKSVLVIGGGPAGLEAAMILGRRGHDVALAERSRELGGRVNFEARLPGLGEWARVRDWRLLQLAKLPNVQVFRESHMMTKDVAEAGYDHVFVATGSDWRVDGRGRTFRQPIPTYADSRTLRISAQLFDMPATGHVVVFDDDLYYMASALAELMVAKGAKVTYVTSGSMVAEWTVHTAEQQRVHRRLHELGIQIVLSSTVSSLSPGSAVLEHVVTRETREFPCDCFIPVTSREPDDALWNDLQALPLQTLTRIGDCKAPGILAHAIYDAHRAAREFGVAPSEIVNRRERPLVSDA
jgi:dimethylamine/trimethylamine dehydrogenase